MWRLGRGAGLLAVLAAAALVTRMQVVGATSKPSKPGTVVTLTDDNFDSRTEEGIWMLDIFAPW